MKEKIKTQKGFIQIPILIAVIVSLIVISGIGGGMVLYEQKELTNFIANIFQKQQSQEEVSQKEQELEQAKLEETKRLIEGQRRQEELRKQKESPRLTETEEKRQRKIAEKQELERQQQLEIQPPSFSLAQHEKTLIIIDKFLNNPTVENLRIFCEEAKTIASSQTKDVLSDDRMTIKTITLPLSETIPSCRVLMYPEYVFISPSFNSLFIPLDDLDNDLLRMEKIRHNEKIQEYNKKYRLYGYDTHLFNSVIGHKNYKYLSLLSKSITIPEIEIEELKEIIEKRSQLYLNNSE